MQHQQIQKNILKRLWLLLLAVFFTWQNFAWVNAKNSSSQKQENYINIEKVYSNSENPLGLELFVNETDLNLELDPDSTSSDQVKLKLDASSLLVKTTYP